MIALGWGRMPADLWAMLLACLAIGGSIASACGFSGRRSKAVLLAAGTLGICLALTALGRWSDGLATVTPFGWTEGSSIVAEGIVIQAPDNRGDRVDHVVKLERAAVGTGTMMLAMGRVQATLRGGALGVPYGSRVSLRGKVHVLREDEQYDRYLIAQRVHATVAFASMEKLDGRGGNIVLAGLFRARVILEDRVALLLPEPEASLLTGLLTGSRGSMPSDLAEAFQITGLTHIVAISGSNITLILMLLQHALFFLPLKWRLLPCALGIVAFVLFVGASASAVRAGVMGCIGLLALQSGRQKHARLAILWAAFLMLCWNPALLWYDAGFQLSFLAVIGITELEKALRSRLNFLPDILGLKEAFSATMAAQIATTPWIAWSFGRLSIISPLSNVLLAPLIPISMGLGAGTVLLGFLWIPLGRIAMLAAWLPLAGVTRGATFLGAIPFASIETGKVVSAVLLLLSIPGMMWLLRQARPDVQIGPVLAAPGTADALGHRNEAGNLERIRDDARAGPKLPLERWQEQPEERGRQVQEEDICFTDGHRTRVA